MRRLISVGICFIGLFSSSCRKHLNPTQYVNYITDKKNGYKKEIKVDGWEFSTQYRPYDYIILMENKGHTTEKDLLKRKTELKGTAWFSMSIKRADNSISPMRYGVGSLEEYNVRLNYYLNQAVNDFRLVYDHDTLCPMSYLFENNYNLTPQETILVGFRLPQRDSEPRKDMILSFVDQVFKNGIIKATYTGSILQKTPDLIY